MWPNSTGIHHEHLTDQGELNQCRKISHEICISSSRTRAAVVNRSSKSASYLRVSPRKLFNEML